jgi:CRISPR-associated protein Cmr6
MATGKIKKIVTDKRYGFIIIDDADPKLNDDYKFTFDDVKNYQELNIGDAVSFQTEILNGKKIATKVKKLQHSATTIVEQPNNIFENNISVPNNVSIANKILIPNDTNEKLQLSSVDNFCLKFNKFACFNGEKFELKKELSGFLFEKIFPSEINEKVKKAANILCNSQTKILTLKTNWRMAIGLGTESVYETGMTLHHIYGIPYIPGQALKGIVRSWIIKNYFNNTTKYSDIDTKKDDPCEIAAFENKLFCQLFGCPEYAYKKGKVEVKSALKHDYMGSIVFFDSFPSEIDRVKIALDIMNPHYGPYYSKGEPPADYYNPVPVNFLTIQDTEFQFVIGIKEDKNVMVTDFDGVSNDTLLNIAEKYLKEALKEMGVGAKTAVGYGYFSETK